MSQTRQHPYRRIRALTYKGLSYQGWPTELQVTQLIAHINRIEIIRREIKTIQLEVDAKISFDSIQSIRAKLRGYRVELDVIFDKWLYEEGIDYKQQYGYSLMSGYCQTTSAILSLENHLEDYCR
jgi:hypothetical protein